MEQIKLWKLQHKLTMLQYIVCLLFTRQQVQQLSNHALITILMHMFKDYDHYCNSYSSF